MRNTNQSESGTMISLRVTALVAAALMVFAVTDAQAAKRKPAADPTTPAASPPGTNQEAIKAELTATLSLANIKVSRLGLADDASLAPVKDAVSRIYDRQESATKDGIAKLKAAGGDAGRTSAAIATINAADDEAVGYFSKNADVKDKISQRVTIINAEIGQIARTPDAYLALLEKCGVTGTSLASAKTLVKEAAKKSGGKTDGDSGDIVLTARTSVRQLMSARQARMLDGALAAK